MEDKPAGSRNDVRIDKWLWAARLFKTRPLATDACRGGAVLLDDRPVKPGHPVRVGAVISARSGGILRTVAVRKVTDKRVGPKLVEELLEDRTPASEYLKLVVRKEDPTPSRPKGSGRPTKKERRQLDEFLE